MIDHPRLPVLGPDQRIHRKAREIFRFIKVFPHETLAAPGARLATITSSQHEENHHVQAHHRPHPRPQPGRRPDLQPPRQAGPRQGPGAAQRLHPCLADLRRGHHPAAAGRTLPRLGVRRGSGALHPALRHHHPPRRGVTARRDRDHRRDHPALLPGQGRAHRGARHGGGRRHHDGRQAFLHRRIGAHQRRRRPADDLRSSRNTASAARWYAWRKSCT